MNSDVAPIDKKEVDASLRPSNNLGVNGLEFVPTSAVALPVVKLVQPTSRDIELPDGTDAPVGQFLFTSLGEAQPELHMALISAHVGDHTFTDDDGQEITKTQVSLIAIERTRKELFLSRFSATSLPAFGKLMSQIKAAKCENAWDREIVVSSEKRESKRGKYWVAKFALGEPVSEDDAAQYVQTWMEMATYFDREDPQGGEAA